MGSERLPGSALGLLVGPQMGALATLSRAGKTGTGAGARREGQWIQGTLSSHQDSAAVADARSGSLQEPRKGEAVSLLLLVSVSALALRKAAKGLVLPAHLQPGFGVCWHCCAPHLGVCCCLDSGTGSAAVKPPPWHDGEP